MRAIKMLTRCMGPIIGIMSATGLIRGLLVILSTAGILASTSVEYQLFTIIADTVLKFLPVCVAISAAKYFKMQNPYIGLMLGLMMVYPTLEDVITLGGTTPLYTLFAGTWFETDIFSTFFGIPIIYQPDGYYYTLIPAIVAVFFASKVEKWISSHSNEKVSFLVVPLTTMVVSFIATILVLGPISNFLGLFIQKIVVLAYNLSPVISSIIINVIYQPMVVLGLHWCLSPIQLNNFAILGYDPVLACMWPSAFTLAGVAMGVYFKTKKSNKKQVCVTSAISALCHIMEPALYALTVPRPRLFVNAVIGSVCGGLYIAITKTYFYSMTGTILGVVDFVNPNGDLSGMYNMMIACAINMIVPFVLTLFNYHETEDTEKAAPKKVTNMIVSPMSGKTLLLKNADDATFRDEKLGKGIVINPEGNTLYAPFDGTLSMVYSTKHALGFSSDEGIEALLHIGIDTVKLNGEYFHITKKQGDRIQAGEEIGSVDLEKIKAAGYNVQSYLIVSNTSDYLDVIETVEEGRSIKGGERILRVLPDKIGRQLQEASV
ncbi:MAG: glucose PTS transporter subunit IIA [Lachnospiraceae bacterium]|nr:glucose PTS transporter subunit IIA [Lachnospiraceae bacterium]